MAGGHVKFCCMNNATKIGNWKKCSIRKIWNSAQAKKIRISGRDELRHTRLARGNFRFCSFARINAAIEKGYEAGRASGMLTKLRRL